jgi:hypothetical protein
VAGGRAGALLALGTVAGGCLHNPTDYESGRTNAAVLTVGAVAASAPADGATLTAITASIPADARADRRTVAFSTTAGTFEGATREASVAADSSGQAVARLRAPLDTGEATVRVTAGGVTRVVTVRFDRAFPDTVLLDANPFGVRADAAHAVIVTATLRRGVGRPSRLTPVTFTATAPAGGEVGRFGPATLSDSTGVVTVRFTPGVTAYRGPVVLQATAPRASGVVTGRVTVDVVP